MQTECWKTNSTPTQKTIPCNLVIKDFFLKPDERYECYFAGNTVFNKKMENNSRIFSGKGYPTGGI